MQNFSVFYIIASLIIGYLMGSIPFGYIIGKLNGIDLTKEGSGSTGTTNALRLIGKKAAFMVLLGDFLKGLIAPLLMSSWLLLNNAVIVHDMGFLQSVFFIFSSLGYSFINNVHSGGSSFFANLGTCMIIASCIGALIGHVKSCWIGFKGGKAVATGVGTLFALDWRVGLITAILWASIVFISKYSSLGGLIAVPLSPVIMFIFKSYFSTEVNSFQIILYTLYCALCGIYIIYKHKANISRLMNGTEPKIGEKK